MIVISIMGLGYWNTESPSKMKKYWKVQEVSIDGVSTIDKFKTKSLSFLDDGKMLLPVHENTTVTLPLKYSKWKHKRVGFNQGVIEIDDVKQSLFDGIYEIEILDHQKPEAVKLTSDKIVIYLKGVESFSLENQTIETK